MLNPAPSASAKTPATPTATPMTSSAMTRLHELRHREDHEATNEIAKLANHVMTTWREALHLGGESKRDGEVAT